jgi:hypothetical protein
MFSSALHIGTASFEVGDRGLRLESAAGLDALVRVGRGRVAARRGVTSLGGGVRHAFAQGGASAAGRDARARVHAR